MNIENVLNEEIGTEFEQLRKIEVGTEKYRIAVDGMSKLVDKAIELERLYAEMDEKAESRETENELKVKQMHMERKDQIVRNGIAIAGIVIPTVVTIWGTLKSLKFEETGTVTTIMGRGFIQKLLPKK